MTHSPRRLASVYMPSYVDRHPVSNVLRYRRAVPERLRPVLKKREITRTLGVHKMSADARKKFAAINAEVEALFARADATLADASGPKGLSPSLSRQLTETFAGEPDVMAGVWENERDELRKRSIEARNPADAARLVLEAEQVGLEARRIRGEPVVTFSAALEAWQSRQKLDNREVVNKRIVERQAAVRRVETLFPGVTLDDFTARQARAFRDTLLAEGRAPSTVKQQLLILNSLRSAAIEAGILDDAPSPFVGVKVKGSGWSQDKRLPLPRDKFAAIVEGVCQWPDEFKFPALFCLFTGARRDEACGLRWGDIERHQQGFYVVHVRRQRAKDTTKTASGIRSIPLHPALVERLPAINKKAHTDHPLSKAHPESVRRRFHGLLRSLGITDPKVTLHSARHTWRDLLVETGATPEIIERSIGHKSQGMARYGSGKVTPEVLWRYVKKIRWPM